MLKRTDHKQEVLGRILYATFEKMGLNPAKLQGRLEAQGDTSGKTPRSYISIHAVQRYGDMVWARISQNSPTSNGKTPLPFEAVSCVRFDTKKRQAQAAPSWTAFEHNSSLNLTEGARLQLPALLRNTTKSGKIHLDEGTRRTLAAHRVRVPMIDLSKHRMDERMAIACNTALIGHIGTMQEKGVFFTKGQTHDVAGVEKARPTPPSGAKARAPLPQETSPQVIARAVIGSGAGERFRLRLRESREILFEVHGLRRGERCQDVVGGILTSEVRNELNRTQEAFEKVNPRPSTSRLQKRRGQRRQPKTQGNATTTEELRILSRKRTKHGETFRVRAQDGRTFLCKVTGLQGQKIEHALRGVLSPEIIQELKRHQKALRQRGKRARRQPAQLKGQMMQRKGQNRGYEMERSR